MSSHKFSQMVRSSLQRHALPIAMYPGMSLVNASVKNVINSAQVQFEIQAALHARYQTPFVLSAMDLSAEAEAFGCQVHFSDNEVPSIIGRRITRIEEAQQLPVPKPGDGRTSVYLETVQKLKALPDKPLVLGGCIGPFSLAARLVGVSEALELTATEPDLMRLVTEKSSIFLAEYVRAFKNAGADGIIMAEPAAGLLSPRSLATFSSNYVRQLTSSLEDADFSVILHNCAAKVLHLPAVLESGLRHFHFGAPMDIATALSKAPSDVFLCGNLDPAGVFCQSNKEEVRNKTASLLSATAAYRNFIISSGCDLPPNSSLASLDAFYEAVEQFNTRKMVESSAR